jgi:tRNA threonylcarbamoyladenosine biosynthesis protein TsaE
MVKSPGGKGKRAMALRPIMGYKSNPMTRTHTSRPEETIAAGRAFAHALLPGTVIALHGDLGAGKTHFVRGIVEGWGGADQATSPTFALLHEYATPRGPVFHLDLYRARSAGEIWDSVHDELDAPHGLIVIEWAERFPELVPAGARQVTIEHAGAGRRTITIDP